MPSTKVLSHLFLQIVRNIISNYCSYISTHIHTYRVLSMNAHNVTYVPTSGGLHQQEKPLPVWLWPLLSGQKARDGVDGEKGEKGWKGYEGGAGLPGPKGEQGDVGETGEEGPQGPQVSRKCIFTSVVKNLDKKSVKHV